MGEFGVCSASVHEGGLSKRFGQVHLVLRPSAVWEAPQLAAIKMEGELGAQRWAPARGNVHSQTSVSKARVMAEPIHRMLIHVKTLRCAG